MLTNKERCISWLYTNSITRTGSAHARPSALAPINTSGNFKAQVSDHFSRHFRRCQALFGFFSRKNPQKNDPRGAAGSPIFFLPQILFLCDLKPHAKFQNPTITPSGRKVTRKKERKRNNAVSSGHLVP
jgi:hypothetical protein